MTRRQCPQTRIIELEAEVKRLEAVVEMLEEDARVDNILSFAIEVAARLAVDAKNKNEMNPLAVNHRDYSTWVSRLVIRLDALDKALNAVDEGAL
jgi:hypothetical protein